MTGRVLVTGGAGYIGSVVVDQLLARGCRVVVLDDLSMGHREAPWPSTSAPESSLEEILTSAWRWHQAHPRGYRS